MPYWDERVAAMSKAYPEVSVDKFHIDILTGALRAAAATVRRGGGEQPVRRHPSDLGPACTGTIGIAPSANLNPTRQWPSLFEPVHGSAPDIAGRASPTRSGRSGRWR